MKTFAILVTLILTASPLMVMACEPTSDQMAVFFARGRQHEEAYALGLAAKADQIFTGVVVDVTDLSDGPYMQLAHIKIEHMLKGDPVALVTARMRLRVNPERDHPDLDRIPSCDEPLDPSRDEPYVVKTYRHLYYVKNGVLLRATGFPLGPPPLQADDEIMLLRSHVSGIRTK